MHVDSTFSKPDPAREAVGQVTNNSCSYKEVVVPRLAGTNTKCISYCILQSHWAGGGTQSEHSFP